jgi:hypothetical protein
MIGHFLNLFDHLAQTVVPAGLEDRRGDGDRPDAGGKQLSQLKYSAPPANEMRIFPPNAREMREHISIVSGKRLRPDIYIS